MSGATVMVMWSCLLVLLAKCRREACPAQVNPSNMKTSLQGIAWIDLNYLSVKIFVLQVQL